jgi:predicted DNA-binding protein
LSSEGRSDVADRRTRDSVPHPALADGAARRAENIMNQSRKRARRNEAIIATRMPMEDYKRLKLLAQGRGLSVSSFVRGVLCQQEVEPTKSLGRSDERNEVFHLSLSHEEREELESNATRARMTTSAYIRARCIYSDIPLMQVDDEALSNALRELHHQGNNLNQIAHRINSAQEQELSETLAAEGNAIIEAKRAIVSLINRIEVVLFKPRR